MAEGCIANVSDTNLDKIAEDVKKRLLITDKESFKWSGGFDALKRLFGELLGVDTKWNSPGGGAKQLESSQLMIRWYSNSFLTIKGNSSTDIKNQLLEIIETNAKEQDNLSSHVKNNRPR